MPDFVDEINPDHADVMFHVYTDASVTYKRDPEDSEERIYRFGLGYASFRGKKPWLLDSKRVPATYPTDKRLRTSMDQERRQYTMQMEFNAAAEALNALPAGSRVILHTDQHHTAKIIADYEGWLGADNRVMEQPVYAFSVLLLREAVDRHFHVTVEHIKGKDKSIPRRDRQRHNLAHNLAGLASGSNKRHSLDPNYTELLNEFWAERFLPSNTNMQALNEGAVTLSELSGDDTQSNEDALENPPLSPFGIIKNDPEP